MGTRLATTPLFIRNLGCMMKHSAGNTSGGDIPKNGIAIRNRSKKNSGRTIATATNILKKPLKEPGNSQNYMPTGQNTNYNIKILFYEYQKNNRRRFHSFGNTLSHRNLMIRTLTCIVRNILKTSLEKPRNSRIIRSPGKIPINIKYFVL